MTATLSRDAFLTRYVPAARRLEEAYRQMRIVAIDSKWGWPGLQGDEVIEYEFQSAGDHLRLDERMLETHQPRLRDLERIVFVSNPRESFVAVRFGSDPFQLEHYDQEPLGNDLSIRWRTPMTAPFQYRDARLVDFLSLPQVTFTAREETREGRPVVHVDYHREASVPGRFTFAPELGYALLDDVMLGSDFQTFTEIDYGDVVDGVPLVKRIESWRREADGTRSLHQAVEVTDIRPGPAPAEVFTLRSLGIDEVA